MCGKPAMTSFKHQVYLHGIEASGYRASTMSHQTGPTPTTGSPPPLCMAA